MIDKKHIVLAVLLVFSVVWVNSHYEDATKVAELESKNERLQTKYNELYQEYTLLQNEYKTFKQDTSKLLAEYLAKEIFWDILGKKELQLACGLAKIGFRDLIPIIDKLPC